ncbi:MAG: FAD-dependent oxidoreductase, partial [Acidobacteria bacterium]|nr:FAD-dependent oxidoreductase [Acidobacteriota bacterium]
MKDTPLSQPEGLARAPRDFHWLEKNIPCQAACPARTDIPGYLAAIARGDFEAAYRINLADNVFPGVLGRVCARPCEPPCRHGWPGLGEPVAICFSKRAAADHRREREPVVLPPLFPATGKKVAVVGAGVAGLAAARELARMGHEVTVYERHDRPGGMMRQGIPAFRLPREVVDFEIRQVEAAGVRLVCGTAIGRDRTVEQLLAGHDAVVLAAGTLRPNIPDWPGAALKGVEHGLEFLLAVNERGRRDIGRRVVVVGGGFTAIDCARVALRLGAEKVGVYYRRTVDDMRVTPGELEEMPEEGIPLETQVAPVAFDGSNGSV